MGLRGRLPATSRLPRGAVDLDAPPAPDHLSAELAETWATVWGFLASSGRGHLVDEATVAAYLDALHVVERAQAEHAALGSPLMASGSTGQPVEHPLLKLQRDAARDATRYAGMLGLTPTSRVRLGVESHPAATFTDGMAAVIGKSPRVAMIDEMDEPPLQRRGRTRNGAA